MSFPQPTPRATPSGQFDACAFADAVPVPAWVLDASGQCQHVNRAWSAYVGGPPARHHGWGWLEAVRPGDRASVLDAWATSLAAQAPLVVSVQLVRRDGEGRWHEVRVTPAVDAAGMLLGWAGCAVDVQEERGLREQVEERETQLEAALEAGTMARFAYDLEHRVLTADDALGRMLPASEGSPPEDGVEGFAEQIHPEDRGRWLGQIRRAMDPLTPTFFVDFRLRGARGRSGRRFGSRGRVRFDASGRPAAISGVLFELSDGRLTDPRD